MGIVSSMETAITGLEANGQALGVVSDNIVNSNTTGFKASRGEFHNVLSQDFLGGAGGGIQIGHGTELRGVTGVFTQGAVTHTERGTDVAISGNGFFCVNSDTNGPCYTRDGSFRFDKEGWLTNLTGARVQAYQGSPEGKITGKIGDIRLPYKTIPAKPTDEVELHINLDARSEISEPINLKKPDETSQFTAGTQIFDSVGNAHAVTVYFNKTEESKWEWYAMTDGENLAGGKKGEPSAVMKGKLTFDEVGRLKNCEESTVNTNFAGGAVPDQKLHFNFGDTLDKLGSGVRGTTQFGEKSGAFRNIQNGCQAGTLVDTSIDGDGLITGIYTNGQNRKLGQIAIARFEGTERLSKVGENLFRETSSSGQPLVGKANTNGRGQLLTKSLEQSNVDIAKEFVDMIKYQRGFQASAKTITTSNEMLDEVIKIARG